MPPGIKIAPWTSFPSAVDDEGHSREGGYSTVISDEAQTAQCTITILQSEISSRSPEALSALIDQRIEIGVLCLQDVLAHPHPAA